MKELTILTGASRGMGLAIAKALMHQDMILVTMQRHPNEALEADAKACGCQLIQLTVDLADVQKAAQMMADTLALVPGWQMLDRLTLICNAGVNGPAQNNMYALTTVHHQPLTHHAIIIPTITGAQNIASAINTHNSISLLNTFLRNHFHALLIFFFICLFHLFYFNQIIWLLCLVDFINFFFYLCVSPLWVVFLYCLIFTL